MRHTASLFLRKLHFSTDSVLRKHSNLDLWLARQLLVLLPGYAISNIYILANSGTVCDNATRYIHFEFISPNNPPRPVNRLDIHSLGNQSDDWPIAPCFLLLSHINYPHCSSSVKILSVYKILNHVRNVKTTELIIYMLVEIHRAGFVYMRHSMLVLFSWLQNNNLSLVY